MAWKILAESFVFCSLKLSANSNGKLVGEERWGTEAVGGGVGVAFYIPPVFIPSRVLLVLVWSDAAGFDPCWPPVTRPVV